MFISVFFKSLVSAECFIIPVVFFNQVGSSETCSFWNWVLSTLSNSRLLRLQVVSSGHNLWKSIMISFFCSCWAPDCCFCKGCSAVSLPLHIMTFDSNEWLLVLWEYFCRTWNKMQERNLYLWMYLLKKRGLFIGSEAFKEQEKHTWFPSISLLQGRLRKNWLTVVS